MMPRISVVLPTRDRAALLADCLMSLTRQTIPADAFEVLVVDNGSTDDTLHVVRNFSSCLALRCVAAPEPGLHIGRHAGMREARTDLLVFGDDDIVADPGWLASIDAAFRDAAVVLVGGNNHPLFEVPPPAWLLRWWERPVSGGRALGQLSILDLGEGEFDIDPRMVWGCNFSVRRAVLEQVGGFHPDGVPHDRLRYRGDGETAVSEAIHRRGLRARFHSGASVKHRVSATRMTVSYFEKRSHAQGVSDSYSDLRRHGGRCPLRVRLLRRLGAHAAALKAMIGAGEDDGGRALRQVRWRCLSGYLAGYAYHQREVARDLALRDWVLKENYLE